jgi:anti-anti-sigma factor
MNTPQFSPTKYVFSGATELVKGQEQRFLEELNPIVRQQSVCLDLSSVQRIDAAGLTALIRLYRAACEAGQRFTVANPSARAAEILRLVGLDRVLESEGASEAPLFNARLQETAA